MALQSRDTFLAMFVVAAMLCVSLTLSYFSARCTRPAKQMKMAGGGSLSARRSQVKKSEIWMGDIEVELVIRRMNNVRTYLEWGSGGSTTNFPRFARRRAVSIEHDPQWCARMKRKLRDLKIKVELRCVLKERLTSRPFVANSDGTYLEFRKYVDEIEKIGEPQWDFVLIDGRARVDAAIKVLSFLGNHSHVVLHDALRIDYNDTSSYRPVLDYYDVIDRTGGKSRQGMAVLQRKKSLSYLEGNHSAVQAILNEKYALST